MNDVTQLTATQNEMALECIIAIVIAALYLFIRGRKPDESTPTWPVWVVFGALLITLAITGG